MREDEAGQGQREDETPSYSQFLQNQQGTASPQGQVAPNQSGGSTPPSGSNIDWTNKANWTAQNINNYAASRGVTDPNFANYWIGKGDELYSRGQEINDPNYAFYRLQHADEFGNPLPADGGGGAGGGAYVPGKGVPGMGSIFGAGGVTGSAAGNSLFDFLMQRAHQGVAPDPNDPIIKNQVGAFGATQTRAARDAEAAAAERGGPNSNQDAVRRSMAEKVGQNTSGYQAQLLGNEVAARRAEIQNALSGAQGLLTDTQRAQLQEELAQLQLGQGAYQFDTNMQFMNSPLYGG